MKLFDLHCDTLTVAMKQQKSLTENDLQLSFRKGADYLPWVQTMAVFVPDSLRGQAARDYYDAAVSYLHRELAQNGEMLFCKDGASLQQLGDRQGVQLAVEGGAVLAGRLNALEELKRDGVRMITLTWNGANEIGGGAGEPGGLTPFGKAVVHQMEQLHMAIDISHASDALFADVCTETDVPLVASHSDSRAVCDHRRNLTDAQFSEIVRRGGLVGLNLYPQFISGSEDASLDSIYRHVDRFLSLNGASVLAIGTDFDGASMPSEVPDIVALGKLKEDWLRRNLPESLVDRIFFENASQFFTLL